MNQPSSTPAPRLELWGGTESTTNRVGDVYFHQLDRNHHASHIEDLDRFAALGIRTLRYPVLWERVSPDSPNVADWAWSDQRLHRLRELGIQPIVGLLHHGSGPRYTHLLDPQFPHLFAAYAAQVAARYPWVIAYTPINEPLTTARFSGLYGHWYPHGHDDSTFARALINQLRATALAMQAIRTVNPAAQLVQTEDLGKTYSTPLLKYQADFDNQRGWLTYDLLCGTVDHQHPLWSYLIWSGIEEQELEWFLSNPCPPDIIGVNHYLTSERFLDDELSRYPVHTHGGNGRHAYADVEAVRVLDEGLTGPLALLTEVWTRYHLPIAVTEVQLACTREEQLRWLAEVWRAAQDARQGGADIRAVTAWALLGSFDWHCLLTRCEGNYEPGVFDLRAPKPRPTALATMIRQLAAGEEPSHPTLSTPGWWRRPSRLIFGLSRRRNSNDDPVRAQFIAPAADRATISNAAGRDKSRRYSANHNPSLLIIGANGTLGRAFARLCLERALPYRLVSRQQMDIADPQSVAAALDNYRPWAVVNAAGYVRVDDAEREADACWRENATGAFNLAAACAQRGIQLLTFSSDLVFDGSKGQPYVESDVVNPLNVYGQSKAAAERGVLTIMPDALVIRSSAFFGPWDQHNFITVALRELKAGRCFTAASDATVSPTYVPDLVNTSLDLLIDAECGLWHLANDGAITWAALAQRAAELAGFDARLITPVSTAALSLSAPRPLYSVLGSERGWLLPALDDALARYLRDFTGWHAAEDRPITPSPIPTLAANFVAPADTRPSAGL